MSDRRRMSPKERLRDDKRRGIGCTWADSVTGYAMVRSRGVWRPYDHLGHIAERIQAGVARGGYRAILNMPPRHGKSMLLSRFLPGWFLHWWPQKSVMLCSYESSKAADWGREVRDDVAPGEVRKDISGAGNWQLVRGGGMLTTGIGGPITGRGADLLIVDDPHKNWDEAHSPTYLDRMRNWFGSTAWTRLEPGASVILVMTRWQEGDLTGTLLRDYDTEGWDHIVLPALATEGDPLGRAVGEALCPERYSRGQLLAIRQTIGPSMFAGMYQQTPEVVGGNLWKRSWFQTWHELPDEPDQWLQSWDLTFKGGGSSWVVGQVWCSKGGKRYLVDQVRGRWDFVETLEQIRGMTARWPRSTGMLLVEDKANGPAVISTLRREGLPVVGVEPYGSKVARAMAVQGDIMSGLVYLPDPRRASWVEAFLRECTLFPNARNDDQVDTTAQALIRLRQSNTLFIAALT